MSESDQNTASSISNKNAKRILALLKKGDEKINLGTHHDVVLVLGNTGSGKTTFTQFIAGNNDELFSMEADEGLGEFIISDTNNKINFNTTLISKTTFPEVLFDNETKTAYVDCPGFNGHNEAYDIANSYFIKKVLDKAQNVKIVLIVTYSSLRKGGNGTEFLELLKYVTILIKNIEKYVDSLALVATKVDNRFDMRQGVPIMVPDHSIVEQIVKYLQEVKNSLNIMKDDDSNSSKIFYEDATKLLEALLSKKDNEYTRIGIFRRPSHAGKVSHMEILQNGKKFLKKMIDQNLKYSPIDKSDIGYSVSDKSKIKIQNLIYEMNDNVISTIATIAQNVIEYYKELEENMFNDDMYALLDQLEEASVGLKQISKIDRSASTEELVNNMCESFTKMAIKIPKSYIRDIKNVSKFLGFLQETSGHNKSESFVSNGAKELESAVNAIDNSLRWYNLLGNLHNRLSEYDIQKNTTIFHVPKLEAKNAVFQLDAVNDFSTFIDEIANTSHRSKIPIYENIKGIYLDDTKIKYFDQLINVTLKTSTIITCTDDSKRLQVVGEYVKLSEITGNACYIKCTSVQILAKHSVFIDTDLSTKNDISIIAPRWCIIGLRKISLDGTDGQPHSVPKANDGSCVGCHGKDGLPGNPGASGGHFFGIGSIFENPEKLTVSANGGEGGIGQHGGDGMVGERGKNAREMEEKVRDVTGADGGEWYVVEIDCDVNQSCYSKLFYYKKDESKHDDVYYTVRGNPGGRGGNAGRGGAGGSGGEAGTVTLIGSNNISTSVLRGVSGTFGLHGNCGGGGEGGNYINIIYNKPYNKRRGNWTIHSDKADNGDSGSCLYISNAENANYQGRQKPQKKELYPPSHTISNLMIQLLKNSNYCITKKASQKFYFELQNNEKLKNFYYLEFVMHSLHELGKHFNQFPTDTSKAFYQFLLSKIAQDDKTETSTKEIKSDLPLEMLQIVLSAKLIMLKTGPEKRLPLNRNAYFDMLYSANFNEIYNYYSNAIVKKITDADKFMETMMVTEMNDVKGRIDIEIAQLSHKDVGEEMDALLFKRKFFSCFEFFKDFSSLALSLANADLSIINSTKIVEFVPYNMFHVSGIPADSQVFLHVERFAKKFELEIDRKIDTMTWVISNELAALQATGYEYDKSYKRLRLIVEELNSFVTLKEKTFTANAAIQNAILRFDEINLTLLKLNPNNTNLNKIIRKYQNHMTLIQFDAKMYQNIKSECNIERLVKSLDSVNNKTSYLNSATKAFFDLVIPILKTVGIELTRTTGYKPKDTRVIRQLVLAEIVKMKAIAYSMTEQSEMDEDLQTISENIDETFTTLINIYDSLNNHEDRTHLYAFFRYAEEHNSMQKMLPSFTNEYILYEYERSIDTFKQYVFPYDRLYPSNFTVPSVPNLDKNLNNLKSIIATNVKSLQSNLIALGQSNEYLLQDYFNNTSSSGAFFIWKSEGYGNSIKRFLRGKEIALKAIANENDGHEMIKFDSINLAFHSSNDTMQQLLNDNLINFSLRMTHSGTSYFRFCKQTRTTYTDSLSLSYNLNETSIHIEPMLSPYTTWIMKLDPINGNVSFIDLEPFQEEKIHLLLEGHATYMNALNQSTCEKFLTGPMTTNYTSLMTNNIKKITPNQGTSNSTRKRRDVSSQWSNFIPSFQENFSFLNSFNPFNFFIGTNSQYDQPSSPKSLEWSNNSSSSTNTIHLSSNLNSTLPFLDYIVRNITKRKPYHANETTLNLDQVRIAALEIMDRFEATLLKFRDELVIPQSQPEFDPVKLMSLLEREIINGDPSAITKVLQNSVTLDPQFKGLFDAELVHMLDQMNDHSNQRSQKFQYKSAQHLQNHYADHTFENHVNEEIPSRIENQNTSLLN